MSKPAQYGETLAREVDLRIDSAVADTAAITALTAVNRTNGMLILEQANSGLWWFDDDSALGAGPTVLVPDAGTGRWLSAGGGGGGVGVGAVNLMAVRYASAGALAAYTRTGNVILADAVGALGAQDGITGAVGDRFLLQDGAADADNGPYRIDVIGAAGAAYQMTRVGDADASAEVTAGMLVYVSEGTVNGNEWQFLTADDPVVLNTTALTFVQVPSLQDLAATTVGLGGDLLGLYDIGAIVTATTCGAAIVENRTAIDVDEANLVVHRPGVPMINRLIMLGAPGAIVATNTVTIGTDIYEFNAATPPAGGTAGSIWVYQGADSAASRANFINAVNNVVDANNITYDGAVAESMIAVAGTTLGTVDVRSAAAIGGALAPSGTATATTETLATGTDIWDEATMYAGQAQAATQTQMTTVTLSAAMITQGFLEVEFDFTPVSVIVSNRMRQQDEAYVITADRIVLTLTGGGAPNNQAADVLDFIALG